MPRSQWDKIRSSVKADAKNRIRQMAFKVAEEARALAPVSDRTVGKNDEPHLRDTIKMLDPEDEGSKVRIRVIVGARYGKMVEFGYNQYGPFRHKGHHPYLYPSFEKVKAEVDRYFSGYKPR